MPDTFSPAPLVTLADVQAAAKVLEGNIERTELAHSRTLSAITGADVWIKFENRQYTAAFKERGALNKLSKLTDDEKRRGVIAASAGNHAQGVAYHARRLGIPATIVMAETTPFNKVEHTRDHGARVILEGLMFDEAKDYALKLGEKEGLVFIHPFDDLDIIAGQGTIALEMLADQPDLDTLVVPIGGGGLISGIAVAAKALRPDIKIIGVEAAMYPCMHAALRGKTPKMGGATIAEGIAVKEVGKSSCWTTSSSSRRNISSARSRSSPKSRRRLPKAPALPASRPFLRIRHASMAARSALSSAAAISTHASWLRYSRGPWSARTGSPASASSATTGRACSRLSPRSSATTAPTSWKSPITGSRSTCRPRAPNSTS
jgi:threonine dehydratase